MIRVLGLWACLFISSSFCFAAKRKPACSEEVLLEAQKKGPWAVLLVRDFNFVADPKFELEGADANFRLNPDPIVDAVIEHNKNTMPNREFKEELPGLYAGKVLTRKEEEHLFSRMNYLKFFAYSQVQRVRLEELEKSDALKLEIDTALSEAQVIENQILLGNTKLLKKILTNRFKTMPSERWDEYFSVGVKGILRAIELFELKRGNKFSTYVTWAIQNNLSNYIGKENQRKHRYILTDSIAMWELEQIEDPKRDLDPPFLVNIMNEILEPREIYILTRRLGLDGEDPWTLDMLGAALGVTKERVRQVQDRVQREIKNAYLNRGHEP